MLFKTHKISSDDLVMNNSLVFFIIAEKKKLGIQQKFTAAGL